MFVFDAHLDLSLNALEWNRDLRAAVDTIRQLEQGMEDLAGRGEGTVTFPEMRRGGVGFCVATLIGGCMKPAGPVASWESPHQAWAMTQGQLEWYRAMEEAGELTQIKSSQDLENTFSIWKRDPDTSPIGYVLSLEGSDSLIDLGHLERRYDDGLRALGPAHYGAGRYALGHDRQGPLSPAGRDLLAEMDRLGIILDVTHLCEESFWQALDIYTGPVWASHHNCRALVEDPRQLSDAQLKALAEKGGLIGVAFDAWMLVPGWVRGQATQSVSVSLSDVADHIDHICQLLGSSDSVMIGSDLDGGFGREQSPSDLDSIADMPKLSAELIDRGYSQPDVERIFHKNVLEFLGDALPR